MRETLRNFIRSHQPTIKRRAAYSLAAGAAACAAATEAQAVVVYSGLQNISIGQFGSQNLNLDGNGYPDILLKNYVFGGGNYQGAYVNVGPGKVVGFQNGLSYVSALTVYDPIDETTVGPTFVGSMAYGAANPSAKFNSVENAFIGLSFPSDGNLFYGWVRVAVNNAAGTFLIKDWAYNDQTEVASAGTQALTDAGISAGDTGDGFVPEPGTLGLLAVGAAGLMGLRRRRNQAA
jgi:PEP-CTERM motif